jgi:hypothetical protein
MKGPGQHPNPTGVLEAMTLRQGLIIGGIFIAGIAIDRAFVTTQPTTSMKQDNSASGPAPMLTPFATTPAVELERFSGPSGQSKKALEAILKETDPRRRMTDLQSFINPLKPGEYADALKRIRRLPGSSDRDLASRLLISSWVRSDPHGALQFAASNAGSENIAENVFQQEAANGVQGAIDRALALPNPELRYQALRGVVSYLADTDPTAALALAQRAGDFPGNEPLSNLAYREWANVDPAAAAAQAAQNSSDGGWRSPINQVVRTWASQDPAAAANWALSLGDSQTESRVVSQAVRQWARADLTAATNWVSGLPDGQARDSASASMAFAIAPNDPQTAVTWANSIADEAARNTALQRLSAQVMWRDPTNGAAVLQAAGVPANLIPPPGQGRPPFPPGP